LHGHSFPRGVKAVDLRAAVERQHGPNDASHHSRSAATLRGVMTGTPSPARVPSGVDGPPLPGDDPELMTLDLRELRSHWAVAAARARLTRDAGAAARSSSSPGRATTAATASLPRGTWPQPGRRWSSRSSHPKHGR
jgi:hypothetical protein